MALRLLAMLSVALPVRAPSVPYLAAAAAAGGSPGSASAKAFTLGGPDRNNFLKDGQRFRFAAGSMHYWRNKPSEWKPKLQLMKDMGLNAVLTPTNWAWHEPAEQQWEFSGEKDLVKFVRTAEEVGLLVVLRLGSYATAEMVLTFQLFVVKFLFFWEEAV